MRYSMIALSEMLKHGKLSNHVSNMRISKCKKSVENLWKISGINS